MKKPKTIESAAVTTQPDKLFRCAIYARISPKPEGAVGDNYSLPAQLHEMKAFALKKYGCLKPDEYVDRLASGGSLGRPALDKLRDGLKLRLYDVVIALCQDRWSREELDSIILDTEIEKAGAVLDFVQGGGGFDNTAQGYLGKRMHTVFAQYERLMIKDRSRRCRREKSREGLPHSCMAPDGYRYEGHKFGKRGEYVIEPERAKVVTLIFRMAAEGSSLRRIAIHLNEHNIPTKKGLRWSRATLYQVLEKTCYYGELIQNDSAIRVPAIITKELWDQAHEAQARNKANLVGRPSRKYLLTGLLVCGKCGRRICGSVSGKKGAYRCSNFNHAEPRSKNCDASIIVQHLIEPVIWNAVWDTVCDAALLWQTVEAYHTQMVGRPKAKDPVVIRIDRARREVAEAVRILKDPDKPIPYAEAKADLEAARKRLAEAEMAAPRRVFELPRRKDIEAVSRDLQAMREELTEFADRRKALALLVEKIRYADREAEIHCRLNLQNCCNHVSPNNNFAASIPFILKRRVA